MGAIKSVFPLIMVMLLMLVAVTSSQAQQACSNSLTSLNICAPFVVPGAASPSTDCCNALQGIDHDCLCNMLRIASRVPSQCNLPAVSCGGN